MSKPSDIKNKIKVLPYSHYAKSKKQWDKMKKDKKERNKKFFKSLLGRAVGASETGAIIQLYVSVDGEVRLVNFTPRKRSVKVFDKTSFTLVVKENNTLPGKAEWQTLHGSQDGKFYLE